MPMSMSMGMSMSNVGSPPITLPKKVSKILSKYNATMLLPGVDGSLRFGYQPGNYRESTGQTLAAADQQVGLVVDAARAPGPELASAANWVPSAGTTISGGVATSTSVVGGNNIVAQDGIGTASKMILVTATINVVAGGVQFRPGGVSGPTISASGTYTQRIQSGAVDAFRIIAGASGFTGSITLSSISVRELPGIHASQSTSGFQPVLRQEPILGDEVAPALTSGNWLVSGTDATHILTWQGGGGFRYQSDTTSPQLVVQAINRLVVGRTYEFVVTVSAYTSGTLKTDSVSGSAVIPASAGTHRFIGVAQSTALWMTRNSTNVDLTVSSISVREITGYDSRIQSWQFDPALSQRLSLSAVPFQTQDVSFAVCAYNPTVSDATFRRMFEFGGNGTEIQLSAVNGGVNYSVKGDTGSQASLTAGGTSPAGSSRVVSVVNTSLSSRYLRVDGVQQGAVNTTVIGTSTANAATLGNRAAGDRAFSGFKHLQIFGKGTTPPTESELRTLERWAAQLQQRSI